MEYKNKYDETKDCLKWVRKHGYVKYTCKITLPKFMKPDKVTRHDKSK